MKARLLTWIAVISFALTIGTLCQILFFKTPTNTVMEAFSAYTFLWLIYIFVALALGERIFRNWAGKA
jgi:ABC-type bacteriocin/lantibiotic exporter with double-glycine peptidase domain